MIEWKHLSWRKIILSCLQIWILIIKIFCDNHFNITNGNVKSGIFYRKQTCSLYTFLQATDFGSLPLYTWFFSSIFLTLVKTGAYVLVKYALNTKNMCYIGKYQYCVAYEKFTRTDNKRQMTLTTVLLLKPCLLKI